MIRVFAPNRIGGQSLIAYSFKIVGALVSFILSWIVARSFGAAGSGLFGLAVSIVQFSVLAAIFGLDQVAVRLVSGHLATGLPHVARSVVSACGRVIALTSTTIACLIWLFRSTITTDVLGDPAEISVLGIMVWAIIPAAGVKILSSALRSVGAIKRAQLIDGPLQTGATALIVGGLIVAGQPLALRAVAGIYLSCASVNFLIGLYFYLRAMPTTATISRTAASSLLLAGLPILVASLSNVAIETLSNVLISRKFSIADVGIFRTCWQTVALLGLVQTAFDSIFGPSVARLWVAGRFEDIAILSIRISALAAALISPVLFVILAFPATVLGIFGPQFVAGSACLRILAIGQLVRLISYPIGSILAMSGERKWIYGYGIINLVVFFVFSSFLIGDYGLEGAALSTVLTIVVNGTITGTIVRKRLHVPVFSPRLIMKILPSHS